MISLLIFYSLSLLSINFFLKISIVFLFIQSLKYIFSCRSSSSLWRLLKLYVSSLDQFINSLCRLLQFFQFMRTLPHLHLQSLLRHSELLLGRWLVGTLLAVVYTLSLLHSQRILLSKLVKICLVCRFFHHERVVVLKKFSLRKFRFCSFRNFFLLILHLNDFIIGGGVGF